MARFGCASLIALATSSPFSVRVGVSVRFWVSRGVLGRRGKGGSRGRTGIDVTDDYFSALVGEQPGAFGTNALPAAGDDGCLACEQAFGVV